MENTILLMLFLIGMCGIFGIAAMIGEYFDWE